ncbi:MAG TPA: hypothetical protein VMH50_07615 [Thermoleophilia bacterium]|nr:hypothetical protein [Thermoleophilia bacterium]
MLTAGSACGAAAFFAQQWRADWRPHLVRTAAGWRIYPPDVLRFTEPPSLYGWELAAVTGPYTLLIDLSSGRVRHLGTAPQAGLAFNPLVSDRSVVWMEQSGDSSDTAVPYWFYDLRSHRRRLITSDSGFQRPSCLWGTTGAPFGPFTESLSPFVARDFATGRNTSLGRWCVGDSLVCDGNTAASMLSDRHGLHAKIHVQDLQGGRRWALSPLGPPRARQRAAIDALVVAGHTLVWEQVRTTGDFKDFKAGRFYKGQTIIAMDLDSGRRLVIARGDTTHGVSMPSLAGRTVVWVGWWLASGEQSRAILGRRLDGSPPFEIALLGQAAVQSVTASGDTVAWQVNGDEATSYIETAKVPQ